METADVLLELLAKPLASFLLRRFLGNAEAPPGAELKDLVAYKLSDHRARRDAVRRFEALADQATERLLPLFERESSHVNVEAVVRELVGTLGTRVDARFYIEHDLNPARLKAEYQRLRPLPERQLSEAETALYDRALGDTVRYLTDVASQLPRFGERLASEQLKRLGRIETAVDNTLSALHLMMAQIERSDVGGSFEDEANYRSAILTGLDYVELFGADLTAAELRRQLLSVAYVSLNVSVGKETQSAPTEQVLAGLDGGYKRLLIRGEAGSGKSTLFRWVSLKSASLGAYEVAGVAHPGRRKMQALSDLRERPRNVGGSTPWQRGVPFLMLLRRCEEGRLPRPRDFPECVSRFRASPPAKWVRSVLKDGRAIVLLDGVDEVEQLHRDRTYRDIKDLVESYPGNRFLVSTRPEAVPEGWLTPLGFTEARIDRMSEAERDLFIDRWHKAVARESRLAGKDEDRPEELAEELKRQLEFSHDVARLTTNPLLCAMICALHRMGWAHLPETRSQLCEGLCKLMIHEKDRLSGLDLSGFPDSYRKLRYEHKKVMARKIAHYMVRNGESSITKQQAESEVADALRSFGQSHQGTEVILRNLEERGGILREPSPGRIDFTHNTFKEYLAAEQFALDGDAGQLASNALDASWRPVVVFAAARDDAAFVRELLVRIVEPLQGPKSSGIRGRMTRKAGGALAWLTSPFHKGKRISLRASKTRLRAMMAVHCWTSALHKPEEIRDFMGRLSQGLFPPAGFAEAEAIAECGEDALPYLGSIKKLTGKEAASCVHALRLIGGDHAMALLRTYRHDTRQSVALELAKALNPLEIDAIVDGVTKGDGMGLVTARHIRDLSPLAAYPQVEKLCLAHVATPDLAPLAELRRLQELDLQATPVADLSPLMSLTLLRRLDLRETLTYDLTPLSPLSALQVLHITGTRVAQLGALSFLKSLELLYAGDTAVCDLSPLANLTALRRLLLYNTPVTDVAPLGGLNGLLELDLENTRVTDLSPLSGLASLMKLNISSTRVSDLSPLSGVCELEAVTVGRMPGCDIRQLEGCKALKLVRVAGSIDDSQLRALSGACPSVVIRRDAPARGP